MYENQQEKEMMQVSDIERKIRNNDFETKEQFIEYLKNNEESLDFDKEKIQQLLNLFDSLHKKEIEPLNLTNYSSAHMENQDLIISKEQNRILTTLEGTSAFTDEFARTQNEMVTSNINSQINADEVFQKMSETQKEEQQLLSLDEAILKGNISAELLQKIRFFAMNAYINPNIIKINPETGIFYNIDTKTTYEVKKNFSTNSYEIYSGNQKIYMSSETPEILEEKTYEQQSYESTLNKPKTRVLRKENPPRNAAFTKIGFLIINIITFALLITTAILLNK